MDRTLQFELLVKKREPIGFPLTLLAESEAPLAEGEVPQLFVFLMN